MLAAGLALACDPGDPTEAAPRDGDAPLSEDNAELGGCQIGENHQEILAYWTDAPSGQTLDLNAPSGSLGATIENTSSSAIEVSVQSIVAMGTKKTTELSRQVIPAKSKATIPINLVKSGAKAVQTNAPGQIILRVVTNPGSEKTLLVWSSPAYLHYDVTTGGFAIYDETVLKSKYHNGDLLGELAGAGGTPGAELVLGNGV